MPRHLLRFTLVAVLICGSTIAFAKLSGPPKGVSGAPAVGTRSAESNCQVCHGVDFPLNDPSGMLEILDLPEQFDLDTDYPIRVRLSQSWNPIPPDPLNWGFQLTAVRADSGSGYGTFIPDTLGADTQLATKFFMPFDATRQWIEHNSSGLHAGETGPVEWGFTWRSPGYAAPKVHFFAAGNAANGDSLASGDYIHTTADSMTFVNVGVGQLAHGGTRLARPSPNPAPGRTELRYTLGREGMVDLAIFDPSGRRIRTLLRDARPAGPGSVTWDGRDAAGRKVTHGLYFAKLLAAGERTARVQKITLSR